MNMFFHSGTSEWFDYLANGSIWLIIVTIASGLLWIGFDLINGNKGDFDDYAVIPSHKMGKGKTDTKTTAAVEVEKGSKSPFAPGNRRKLTAK